MTVSEQIIEEYLKKGKSLKDVPPELKNKLNEVGISKLYKALVENDVIEPVEIDEETESETEKENTDEPEDEKAEESTEEDKEDSTEDDEAEEKPTEDKDEEPAPKRKSKFEDVWKKGKK